MPYDEPLRVAVDLVILTLRERELSVLLVQRDEEPHRGRWALPGGFVTAQEDLEDAAQRVLSDEASLGSETVYLEQVRTFLAAWLPRFEKETRSYVTVAFGCTGGRHRSVYLAEKVAEYLHEQGHPQVVTFHRELE